MALEEYRRKRDFSKTPEPPPAPIKSRRATLSYLIQKHDATRLHYDFRLELDGVLLSWAVTKGPSLNPTDKRLAVRTEDHPLSYGSFEGTIPQREYGGGTVMLWDQGSWEPEGDPHAGLKKGHLAFTLHGDRLKGKWDLVRMRMEGKRENWLLIKKDDDYANKSANGKFLEDLSFSAKSHRSMEEIAEAKEIAEGKEIAQAKAPRAKPRSKQRSAAEPGAASSPIQDLIRRFPEVQLATLVDHPPEGDDWVHEVKYDGYRLLGFMAGGECRLRTRNGKDWTSSFPSVCAALQQLKARDAVVDMEAVVLDAKGKSSFQGLQAALGGKGNAGSIIAYAFDLLWLNGADLTPLPLTERKKKLQALLRTSHKDGLKYSEHVVGQGEELFAKACEQGLEGIIAKQAGAPYVAGRQRSWLKIKCTLRQEFVIAGYSDAHTGDRALGALYVGYRKNGELQYAGKVGTGFTMKSAQDLVKRFKEIKTDTPVLTREETAGVPAAEWRSIHWVKPVLLCEVSFTEWTADGRIRHPSFQGLREDKEANAVTQEKPVKIAPPAKTVHASVARSSPTSLALADVAITHPERVISEADHITKGEVAQYYASVAPFLLPSIVRRPLSLLRCPSGIDGECFFQRNPGKGMGADVLPFDFRNKGKKYEYLYIQDEKGLLEVIQMGTIELHPWGAPIDSIDYPDRMIFDLDPGPDVPFEAVKLAAQDLRRRLKGRGLDSVLKCTGGKGLHVTVPLMGKDKWAAVKNFAGSLAEEMVAATPEAYVATMSKAQRTAKIFIDYFRNDYTATAIADYSVRARPGVPVAMPIEWKELAELESGSQFRMKDVLSRLKGKRPPAVSGVRQKLPD